MIEDIGLHISLLYVAQDQITEYEEHEIFVGMLNTVRGGSAKHIKNYIRKKYGLTQSQVIWKDVPEYVDRLFAIVYFDVIFSDFKEMNLYKLTNPQQYSELSSKQRIKIFKNPDY